MKCPLCPVNGCGTQLESHQTFCTDHWRLIGNKNRSILLGLRGHFRDQGIGIPEFYSQPETKAAIAAAVKYMKDGECVDRAAAWRIAQHRKTNAT